MVASVFSCILGAVNGVCTLRPSVWQTAAPWSWWWRGWSRQPWPRGCIRISMTAYWIPEPMEEGRSY